MATLYFNGAVDSDWATLGNWWTNAGHTTQATTLPTSADDVIATDSILSNSGSAPTVVNFTLNDPSTTYRSLAIAITVKGDATFNDSSYNDNYGGVSSNATFNDSAYNDGYITGDATFNGSSYNNGTVQYGNATFTGSSYNNGTVGGVEAYNNRTPYPIPRGINGSSILGVI